MVYYKNYEPIKKIICGKKEKFDNNIFSFDIETTSILMLNGKFLTNNEYEKLKDKEKENVDKKSLMYIWMFSVNEVVYFGRTWEEFIEFLDMLEDNIKEKKFVFVHNLAFEFQFLRSCLKYEEVFARTSRKVIKAKLEKYNLEFRCTYVMTNLPLAKLPSIYGLDVKKMVGDLDYLKIRNSKTILDEKELGYCENDCLVLYKYIKKELERYTYVNNIPITSTGHVRRELKKRVLGDRSYRKKLYRAINTNPHVYNLLLEAFAGGYTHANYFYTDNVLKNLTSWDFTSSYPYVMVSCKYPSTQFTKCQLESEADMYDSMAYLLVVKLRNVKTKLENNFLSKSKCFEIRGGKFDNGRIIEADELETTITDVDLKILHLGYNFDLEIKEAYYSIYNYLPTQFIEFILEKYVNKTKYKNVFGKEVEYALEKAKFNSLYGMSVTSTINDEVVFDNEEGWTECPLSNEEIEELLQKEQKKCFLSFAYGVWVTAHARYNLLSNVAKLDKFVVYCDTDSIKVIEGYDKNIIENYNKEVISKLKEVSKKLNITYSKFCPEDVFGVSHPLGVFDCDGHYDEFITQGAKKYCFTKLVKNDKISTNDNILKSFKDGTSKILGITVAGVPKRGAKEIFNIKDFKDDFIFHSSVTNKQTLFYIEGQEPFLLTDYQGHTEEVNQAYGCCLAPASYKLGKSIEYADLVTDNHSARAVYQE